MYRNNNVEYNALKYAAQIKTYVIFTASYIYMKFIKTQ